MFELKYMTGRADGILRACVIPSMGLFIYLKLLSVDRITQHLFVGWLINDELEIMWKEVVMTQFAVPALLLPGNPIWNSRRSGRVLKREPP